MCPTFSGIGISLFRLIQDNRAAVYGDAEELVGFDSKVFAIVEAGLAVQLICSKVEIAVGGDGERVRPLDFIRLADRRP